ncbi:Hismacro and SEC14 domain-containing protein [Cinnamomum micranthum f. kanehirae]|uniref:Hismacro and SEC14 domain-containing protein n=1 Tax=Cinnamomum micranthum f. kanehirae TaxID=337451 RepID=A0A443NPL7_9MAGN|nr:Hismacro and SEC14 domain-containing protein [Cinnamomum micranthum f. kanehirae]
MFQMTCVIPSLLSKATPTPTTTTTRVLRNLLLFSTAKITSLHHNPSFFPQTLKPSSSIFSQMSESGGGGSAKAPFTSSGGDANLQLARFSISPSSLVVIQKGDITKWSVDGASDAIVNAANERMLGGGGVDGAIHRAAGPELRAACWDVPEVRPSVRCPTREARITPGFRLPVSHVIHTVGPIYHTDDHPEVSLQSAYRNSLKLAKENNIQYIAFPALSCGVYGYPFKDASIIAISTVKEFAGDFKEVHFVLFSDDIYNVWVENAKELL